MKIYLLSLGLIGILSFSSFGQKRPIQTELFNTTLGPGLSISATAQAYSGIQPSVTSFYWMRMHHVEKRVGNDYYGELYLQIRRASDLAILDSIEIRGNVDIIDMDVINNGGSIYVSARFIDSLHIQGDSVRYSSTPKDVIFKLDNNLNLQFVREFNAIGQFTEMSVAHQGANIYVLGPFAGFGGNMIIYKLDPLGRLIISRQLTGIGYIRELEVGGSGYLYFAGGCISNTLTHIDSINIQHPYNYTLYYGAINRANLRLQWIKIMDDITCERPYLAMDSTLGTHFFAPMNKSIQIDSFQLTKPPNPYDDFIYGNFNEMRGDMHFVRESTDNTGSVHFIDYGRSIDVNLFTQRVALVLEQEQPDTIQWANNLQTISTTTRDPVILEYDLVGNLLAASIYPQAANERITGIFSYNQTSFITGGFVAGYSFADQTNGSMTTTYDQYFLQRWMDLGLGESELKADPYADLNIYPNPSTGEFNFSQKVSGRVVDMQGRTLLNFQGADQISLERLSKGLYFLQTDSGKVLKLIKK